jgi:hypothetical protein
MTLYLVSDNHQPDGVLYCRDVGCVDRRPPRRATMLMKFCSRPYLPACDQCARLTYEHHPDLTTFAPLAEYVDTFAAAKEAALATPEQITGRVIYCDQPPCEQSGRHRMAETCISFDGEHWSASCSECAREQQAPQTRPLDDQARELYWKAAEARSREQAAEHGPAAQPGPREPVSRRARIVTASCALVVLVLGIMLANHGGSLDADNPTGALGTPAGVGWTGGGIFFILLAALIGLAWLGVEISRQNPRKPRPAQAMPSSQSMAVSQEYQQGIPVGQIAASAAVVGAEVLWHHKIREHQARVRDSALGIAPLNNVHAGMKHATSILQQQSQSGSDGNMT